MPVPSVDASPHPFASGSQVDHFQVVRLVGRGGMGEVYLARDTRLGRRVALKVIHPERLGSKAAVERFLREARTTASFSHPHIVAIYFAGEHAGRPYVALEYLEGQTLRERLKEGRPGLRETLRWALAVADALGEAHRHRILHRDLKPENVMLCRDGRLRVVDFGLAKPVVAGGVSLLDSAQEVFETPEDPDARRGALESLAKGVRGTPEYMAPEQWRDEGVEQPADIWALGVMLYELVAGQRPYGSASFFALALKAGGPEPVPPLPNAEELPAALVELIARCLDKAAAERPSADEVARAIKRMLGGLARARLDQEQSPFRGLRPFTEQQADLFFGRDDEVGAFIERMRQEPVLPVVGPSGAGKSSFVQAGVIPRLQERGAWAVIRLRPGRRPFRTLAARLAEHLPGPSDGQAPDNGTEVLGRELLESPHLLSLLLERIASARQARVLLFVDQLEELYTLVQEEQVCQRFIEAICTAADDPDNPMRVVFTLREDFLGRLAGTSRVREALGRVTLIGPPDPAAMEQILVEPLRAVDYRFDDAGLVQEMIAAAGAPASLPLLQFTAQMLWERRDRTRRLLTREAYAAMGGVAGALAAHADGVLEGLPGHTEQTTQEILLRLVTADRTRRVVPRGRLLEGLGPEAEPMLGRLIEARLVSIRRAREGNGPELGSSRASGALRDKTAELGSSRASGALRWFDETAELELVHESLIHTWRRLSRWVERSREDIGFLEEVGQAAQQWGRRGRQQDDLWEGEVLREAELALGRCTTRVPDEVREFLQAGRRKAQRRVWWRRSVLALVGILLLLVVAVFAYQKQQAQQQRQVARHRWAEAQREGARAALTRRDLLEARAKLRASLETVDSSLARALWWRLSSNPLVWRRLIGAVAYSVAFAPDGASVAAACQDRSIYLFDVQTQIPTMLRGQEDQVLSVAFAPSGRLVASGTLSGTVALRDLTTQTIRRLEGHRGGVRWLAFSPDGRRLASGSLDRTVRVWDLQRGGPPRVLRGGKGLTGMSFRPDGEALACGDLDGTVRIWSLGRHGAPRVLQGHWAAAAEVSFSPDGKTLASASSDRSVRLWDLVGGTSRVLEGHQGGVHAVSFDPQGRRLASGSSDGTIRIWDARSGRLQQVLDAHRAAVLSLAFSPDGELLLSGSQDKSIGLWRVAGRAEARVLRGHGAPVYGVDFSPDGKIVASGGDHGTVRLWDTASGKELRVLEGHDGRVTALVFGPDGKYLATASHDRTVRLWRVGAGYMSRVLGSHWGRAYGASFSPDGRLLATGGSDTRVRIWDVLEGVQRTALRGHTDIVYEVSFGSNGKLASASRDGTVRLWDVASGVLTQELQGHGSGAKGVSFGPGEWLVSAGDDGTVRRWQVGSAASQILARRKARGHLLAVHPAGELVGVPWSDGTASLLEVATGGSRALVGHRAEVNQLRFSPDGRLAATTSDDGTVRLWDVARGRPFWRAPVMLWRPARVLTHRGWLQLEPGTPVSVAGKRALQALEQRALMGDATPDGRMMCLGTDAGLELWEIDADRRVRGERLSAPLRRVVAFARGCVALDGHQARLYTAGEGLVRQLAAQAIAREGGELLIASGREVVVLGPGGQERGRHAVGAGVTALGRKGRVLAVGFVDGDIELLPTGRHEKRPAFSPDDASSSPVVRILAGPRDTLAVGYADGTVGLWHTGDGSRLDHLRLHGPVVHLALVGTQLHAVTELGDHGILDLSCYYKDYCEVLREVWQQVPVVWEGGPVVRPPPEDHRCARSGR